MRRLAFMTLKNSVVIRVLGDQSSGKTYTVDDDDKRYNQVMAALGEGDESTVLSLVDATVALRSIDSNGGFTIQSDGMGKEMVLYEGVRVADYIEKKIIEFITKGLPYEYLAAFWDRLRRNPNPNSVEQLYRFLESCECPITAKGTFIAYKAVFKHKSEPGVYLAIYDKKTEYRIGKPTLLHRSATNEDASVSCGTGLHSGSFDYALGFGSSGEYEKVILEVEIDPADVVSVPHDHSSGKCRSCCVIPRAVYDLKSKYESTILVDESLVPSSVEDETINGIAYTSYEVDESAYATLMNDKLFPGRNLLQLFPDTVPKAIANVGYVSTCFKDPANGVYYVVFGQGEFSKKHIVFSPKDAPINSPEMAIVTADTFINSDAVNGYMFSAVSYCRVPTQLTMDDLNKMNDVKKVRHSKWPAMVKVDSVLECYREGKEVFYGVIGSLVFKYQPESTLKK